MNRSSHADHTDSVLRMYAAGWEPCYPVGKSERINEGVRHYAGITAVPFCEEVGVYRNDYGPGAAGEWVSVRDWGTS